MAKLEKENVATQENGEQMYRVKVAAIRGKANDTGIYIGWFPRTWLIPRDVEVVIPKCAVQVLKRKKNEIILYCEEVKPEKATKATKTEE